MWYADDPWRKPYFKKIFIPPLPIDGEVCVTLEDLKKESLLLERYLDTVWNADDPWKVYITINASPRTGKSSLFYEYLKYEYLKSLLNK
jgi:hypothetical protein